MNIVVKATPIIRKYNYNNVKTHRLFGTTDLLFWCSINATADTVPGLELIDSISLTMHIAKATLRKRVLRVPDQSFTEPTDILQVACIWKGWGEINLRNHIGSHGARAKHWAT